MSERKQDIAVLHGSSLGTIHACIPLVVCALGGGARFACLRVGWVECTDRWFQYACMYYTGQLGWMDAD